ncbi:hypothetical protein N9L68_00130 [bacterium]|nr:hypothetical protein [bacterium]
MLNPLLASALQQQAGIWQDQWVPMGMIQQFGFGFLEGAVSVEAAAENESQNEVVVCNRVEIEFRTTGVSEDYRVENDLRRSTVSQGCDRLRMLRATLRRMLEMQGSAHWGTQTDVALRSHPLRIGCIVFTNATMGENKIIYGINATRADYPYWITLYCSNNVHFQLAALRTSSGPDRRHAWHVDALPTHLRQEYDRLNDNCPISPPYSGGIA